MGVRVNRRQVLAGAAGSLAFAAASGFPARHGHAAETLSGVEWGGPYIDAMKQIRREIDSEPDKLRNAPVTTPVGRVDEVRAAKLLNVCCFVSAAPDAES